MTIDSKNKNSEVSDKVAIMFSALCCIHCMAIPLFIVFAPALGQVFKNPLIHILGIALVIPLGLYSFISKIKVHSNKKPLFIGIFGMGLLVLGHIFHVHFESSFGHAAGETIEIVASIVGGASLIFAHVFNIRLCRCHTCEH